MKHESVSAASTRLFVLLSVAGLMAAFVSTAAAQEYFVSFPKWFGDPATTTTDIAVGDIDLDGDLDVVCANESAANTLYLNVSGVLSGVPDWAVEPGSRTDCVALGDVNGDGYLDVVFGHIGAPNTLYLNKAGTLATAPAWTEPGPGYITSGVVLADVDGDGDLDLVCANNLQPNLLYLNVGGVFSETAAWTSADLSRTRAIDLGDVDGDGDLDLVCGNSNESNTAYLNTGGTFGAAPFWSSTPTNDTWGCALGDLDGDGDLDLVCANALAGNNTAYRNTGGTFELAPYWTSSSAYDSRSLDLGDVDKDGDVDAVFGNAGGQVDHLYRNVGGTLTADTSWSSGPAENTFDVTLADLDGDGNLDLVCASQDTSNALYSNTSLPVATTTSWVTTQTNSTYSIAAADVDDDGDVDIVCGNSGQSNTLYRNSGTVVSPDPAWSSNPARMTQAVALGDVDGDRDADLVCGNNGQFNTLYLFDGTTFSLTPDWNSTPQNATQAVALGDVDGDGDLDLVCGNTANETNTMYVNVGGLFEREPVWFSGPTRSTSSIALNDIDDDGDLDLVCGNTSAQPNAMYLNTGGTFSELADWESGEANWTFAVALGDVDSDGDVDLVCGNQNQPNTIYLNDGGVFSLTPDWRSGPANDTRSLALADVDADGDLDLFCGNFNQATTLYINEGGMLSTTPAWTSPVRATRCLAVEDVDGDGDLDLVSGQINQSNTIYPGRKDPAFAGNPLVPANHLPNNPAHLRFADIDHPGADVYRVFFQAVDLESDPLWVIPEYHIEGDTTWSTMSLARRTSPVGPLASSPSGITSSIDWKTFGIPLYSRDVSIRLRTVEVPGRVSVIRHLPSYLKLVQPPSDIVAEPQPDSTGAFREGTDIPVSVTMPVGTQFKTGTLYYRRGGETTYQSISLVIEDGKPVAAIPEAIVGAGGVEFWVEVTTETNVTLTDPPENPAGKPIVIQVTIAKLGEDVFYPARRYRMISFAGQIQEDYSLEDLVFSTGFGPPNVKEWRAWYYDNSVEGDYVELTEGTQDERFMVRLGRGFWFVGKDNRLLSLPDTVVALSTPTNEQFAIALEPGWNMVGHPFDFPVKWYDCYVETATDTLKIPDAYSLVDTLLWWYAPDAKDYENKNVLQKTRAYWIRNNSGGDIVLRVPARKHTAGGTALRANAIAGEGVVGWRLNVRATSDGARDANNFAGYHPRAVSGWDGYDWHDPPAAPGRAVTVYFPHADWGRQSGRFAADIRGGFEELSSEKLGIQLGSEEMKGHVWRFDVAKNFADETAGDEVRLEVSGLENLPEGALAVLIDRRLDRAIDLGEQSFYAFYQEKKKYVVNEEDARFVLVVGGEDFVEGEVDQLTDAPKKTALRQNSPNPFNPSTIIRYDLAAPAIVDLRIYDVSGALVKILEHKAHPAGRYEVGWSGRNENGHPVASGVYFYRLRAGQFVKTRKMVLLK